MLEKEIIELMEKRGFIYKGKDIEKMSEDDFNKGCIEFNIPSLNEYEHLCGLVEMGVKETTCNGEGIYGWVNPEDHKKYLDDDFYGEIPAILVNTPLEFYGILDWGTLLSIKCNGPSRPIISPVWVKENILDKDWYKDIQGE